jgi:hypothetical protein
MIALDISEAQLADLRRALEFDFGPDLSGIRVYIGPKSGPADATAVSGHSVYFGELRFKQTESFLAV